MSAQKKLLILDVDNTLLHTVLFSSLDANTAAEYRRVLLKEFEGACPFKDEERAVIVPRPQLDKFTQFISDAKHKLDIGIYSTGTAQYLSTVLTAVFPYSIGNAKFIWDISYCASSGGALIKSLDRVADELDYPLDRIRMIDDQNIVRPTNMRIAVAPFIVDDFDRAKKDIELHRVINDLEKFIAITSE